jgi:hypothetical protein
VAYIFISNPKTKEMEQTHHKMGIKETKKWELLRSKSTVTFPSSSSRH